VNLRVTDTDNNPKWKDKRKEVDYSGIQTCACKGEVYCISLGIWVVSDSSESHREPAIELCISILEMKNSDSNIVI
jgi:hypothetical protein